MERDEPTNIRAPDFLLWGLVRETDNGTLYLGCRVNRQILSEAVSRLRKDGYVCLVYRNGDPDVDLFPPNPDDRLECLDTFIRSFLNLLRSPGRTAVVMAILAVCLGLGLSMFTANQSASGQLGAVSGKIGTGIIVTPAGYAGLPSGDVILPQAAIAKLSALAHVVSVQPSLTVRYTGSALLKAANPTYRLNGPPERALLCRIFR